MKSIIMRSTMVRSASLAAVAICLANGSSAFAQTSEEAAEDDQIVVTGVRASLDRALDIKRNASGVVEAISAEDIGKFPDTNLAESLQRIPGVSISRVNGEGSQVTARGFGAGFNLVTLNGRQMPATGFAIIGGDQSSDYAGGTSRSFDFSNLASEGVSRLEIYKTARASIPSGGIGAAVNVVTRRPLDSKDSGLSGSIGAKALYDTSESTKNGITPEVSGFLSWSDADQKVGISVFGSYQKRNSTAVSATVNDWIITTAAQFQSSVQATTQITNLPTENGVASDQYVAVPTDSRYHYSQGERERINLQGTLQSRLSDRTVVTADVLYARNSQVEQRSDQAEWFSRGNITRITFDDNPEVATAVFYEEANLNKDAGFEQQYRSARTTLQSYGLNIEHDLSDKLKLTLDGHISSSKSSPNSPNGTTSTLFGLGAPVIQGHSLDFSSGFPRVNIIFNDAGQATDVLPGGGTTPNTFSVPNGQFDVTDLSSTIARTNTLNQKQSVKALRAGLGWDFGDGARFDFGADYNKSYNTTTVYNTATTLGNWSADRPGELVPGGVIEPNFEPVPDLIQEICVVCKFDDFDPKASGQAALAGFYGNAIDLYNYYVPIYSARGGGFDNITQIWNNDYDRVDEKTWALYGQVSWKGEIGEMPAAFMAGVRYEQTKVKSSRRGFDTEAIIWQSDNDFTRRLSPNQVILTAKGSYSNLLPAMDFSIEPVENLKARVSFGRTMARADYSDLFNTTTAGQPGGPTYNPIYSATGNAGNPGLLPLVSDNFDVSLEWYFAPSSYISVGFFDKRVKNFVGDAVTNKNLFGLRDPSSGAPGTRSGTAVANLQSIGAAITDVNLFAMTALVVKNNGSGAAALAEYQSNFTGGNAESNPVFNNGLIATYDIEADANDPLFDFAVTEKVNNKEAHIYGFEIGAQYFLGDTGLGVAGSYTKVKGDVGVDVTADPSVNQFALIGLSDTYNVTLIYDKSGISGRLAYNWRSEYLAQTNRGAYRNPVFVAPFATVDFNLSYDISENLAMSFEGINILGESLRTYGRSKTQTYFAQELKPRFLLGARYKF